MRLWLVRHGVTQWNTLRRLCRHDGIPPSAQGRVQARWLARRLQEETISTIHTSDLARARETAEMIAGHRTQPVQVKVSAAWREINFGDWEGLTYAEITAQYTGQLGFLTDPEHYSPPRGESLAHMLQRVRAGLATIVCSDDVSLEGDVVIVSHGGPLRALLCSVLEIPLERHWLLRLATGLLNAINLLPVHKPPLPPPNPYLLNAQRPAWKKR